MLAVLTLGAGSCGKNAADGGAASGEPLWAKAVDRMAATAKSEDWGRKQMAEQGEAAWRRSYLDAFGAIGGEAADNAALCVLVGGRWFRLQMENVRDLPSGPDRAKMMIGYFTERLCSAPARDSERARQTGQR